MKMLITETALEYKSLPEEVKASTILVLIKMPNSDMYYVKKGRYKLKLPRYISKDEITEMILYKKFG